MKKRSVRSLIEGTVIFTVTLLLFRAACAYALIGRGYPAIGGEYCVWFLPLFWYAAKGIIRDFLEMRVMFREGEDD